MIQTDYPLVSVIIATYNRRDYITAALDSVLGQTYPNVELIVVDDGSTDGTRELLSQRYRDDIQYIYQDNQGRSIARNHGITNASGKYIAFLDSDDLWLPDKLLRQVALMEECTEFGLTHTFVEFINGRGDAVPSATKRMQKYYARAIRRGYSYEAMCRQCTLLFSTVMVRSSVISTVGVFDKSTETFEDWDWYLRIALATKIGSLQLPLTKYRLHEGNSSSEEFLRGQSEVARKHLTVAQELPHLVKHRVQRNLYLHLADVAYKREQGRECAFWFRRAVQLDPKIVMAPENFRYLATSIVSQALMRRMRRTWRRVIARKDVL